MVSSVCASRRGVLKGSEYSWLRVLGAREQRTKIDGVKINYRQMFR